MTSSHPAGEERGPVAFVLAGGGSLGAVQAGMLKALTEAGVEPEVLVGTSVGALNGARLAGGADPVSVAEFQNVWRNVERGDVFPVRPLRGLSALLTGADAVFSADGLRRLLADHLRFQRLEEAPIPLAVVAADVLSGREVVLRSGDAVEAVLASTAIPGIFPPVSFGDVELIDGGFVNYTPISTAVDLGASVVYVLPTGFPCTLTKRPRGALGLALHGVTNLLSQRLAHDIVAYRHETDLRVVPPPCPLDVSAADFDHTDTLLRRAEETTRAWLGARMPSGAEERLVPHHIEDVAST